MIFYHTNKKIINNSSQYFNGQNNLFTQCSISKFYDKKYYVDLLIIKAFLGFLLPIFSYLKLVLNV